MNLNVEWNDVIRVKLSRFNNEHNGICFVFFFVKIAQKSIN